jgi:hypothetical protein
MTTTFPILPLAKDKSRVGIASSLEVKRFGDDRREFQRPQQGTIISHSTEDRLDLDKALRAIQIMGGAERQRYTKPSSALSSEIPESH